MAFFEKSGSYRGYCYVCVFCIGMLCLTPATLAQNGGNQLRADSLISFQQLRADSDHDSLSDFLGKEVRVSGIATVKTGLLNERNLQIFIQNDSSGLSLFGNTIGASVSAGDSVVARGVVGNYFGLTEVRVTGYKVFHRERPFPFKPVPVSRLIGHPERYEEMLVQGEGTIVDKGTMFNGKYFRLAPVDTSSKSVMVYVSNFHSLYKDFNFDVLSIGDRVKVTGVLSLYDPDGNGKPQYKIFLRTPADLQYASLPRHYLYIAIAIVLAISCFIFGLVVLLRHRVNKKTSEIKKSLQEKEILVREIHHRVKNNMAVVSGLLELQISNTEDEEARRVLRDSQVRIHSMALVHDKLYNSDNISEVDMQTYIPELVNAISVTFKDVHKKIETTFNIDPVRLDIERVVPCGLLINELVVNAYKHAFHNSSDGILTIGFKRKKELLELTVADNGPGLPDGIINKSGSLGMMLVDTFARELEADFELNGEEGACFIFRFAL